MNSKSSHAALRDSLKFGTIVSDALLPTSSIQLIQSASRAQLTTLTVTSPEDANVSNVKPQDQWIQSQTNVNARSSMELKWSTRKIQTNVFVHQTCHFGMVNTVSPVQPKLNMIQRKNNATTVHKDSLETITVTHVFQDFEENMIFYPLRISRFYLFCLIRQR